MGNRQTGQTEGAEEGMDVASEDSDMDGFQTVRRKRKAASPEHMKTIDLVVYKKGSSENLACPRNARNIRDAIVKAFGLVERIQVAGESRPILCKTEAQKAAILNSKTLQKSGNVIYILCTLQCGRSEESKKAHPANKAVVSGINVGYRKESIKVLGRRPTDDGG